MKLSSGCLNRSGVAAIACRVLLRLRRLDGSLIASNASRILSLLRGLEGIRIGILSLLSSMDDIGTMSHGSLILLESVRSASVGLVSSSNRGDDSGSHTAVGSSRG